METKANYVAIGLFTLLLTALGFGFVFWIAKYDENTAVAEVTVRFRGSVAGLSKGGQVLFNGIKVGEVAHLNYDPDHPQFVKASLRVDRDIPLKKDTNIELSYQGLTGVGYVEMRGGSPDLPNLLDQEDVPELTANFSAFEDLMTGAREILARTESTLQKIETLVDDNDERISQSIANIEQFTQALGNNSDNINTFLIDASQAAKGLANLSSDLSSLSTRAENLIGAVEPESVRKSVRNIEQFTERLANASASFDTVVADASQAAKGINNFSTSLTTSLGKVDKLVDSVDPAAVTASVKALTGFAHSLEKSSGDIDAILGEAKTAATNISQFSRSVSSRTDDFNAIISDARELAGRLNETSKRVDGLLGKVDGMLSDEEGGKTIIEEVTLAARSIRNIATKFEANADEISKGLARFSGKGLRDVETMVGDARRTLQRLEGAVEKLETDPQSLIFGGDKVKTYNKRY